MDHVESGVEERFTGEDCAQMLGFFIRLAIRTMFVFAGAWLGAWIVIYAHLTTGWVPHLWFLAILTGGAVGSYAASFGLSRLARSAVKST